MSGIQTSPVLGQQLIKYTLCLKSGHPKYGLAWAVYYKRKLVFIYKTVRSSIRILDIENGPKTGRRSGIWVNQDCDSLYLKISKSQIVFVVPIAVDILGIRSPRLKRNKFSSTRKQTIAAMLWSNAVKSGQNFSESDQTEFFNFVKSRGIIWELFLGFKVDLGFVVQMF